MIMTLAVTLAALAWLTFIVWYSIRAKWWKNPVGRNTFGVSTVLFVILARITLLRWFPHLQQHDIPGIIVYSVAALFGVQRIWFMEKAQREINRMRNLGFTRRKTDI